VKLLLDENLSPLHARTLRELGHDAVSAVERGLSGADDSVVRAFASESSRILITLDADFANVLRYPPSSSPGVIRLRIHPATEGAIDVLLRSTILRLAGMSLHEKLVVADLKRVRIRG
jgi:predicted nuclease of predicted toxin-antitoxin system